MKDLTLPEVKTIMSEFLKLQYPDEDIDINEAPDEDLTIVGNLLSLYGQKQDEKYQDLVKDLKSLSRDFQVLRHLLVIGPIRCQGKGCSEVICEDCVGKDKANECSSRLNQAYLGMLLTINTALRKVQE